MGRVEAQGEGQRKIRWRHRPISPVLATGLPASHFAQEMDGHKEPSHIARVGTELLKVTTYLRVDNKLIYITYIPVVPKIVTPLASKVLVNLHLQSKIKIQAENLPQ